MIRNLLRYFRQLIHNSAHAIAGEWRSQPLSWLANFATLCGLAIAVYALVNPATVARYLDEISGATQSSADSLVAIERDTPIIADGSQRTASATEALAAALRLRPKFSAQFFLGATGSSEQLQVKLNNQTTQIIRELELTAIYDRAGPITFGPFVLPPSEELFLNIDGIMPRIVCYQYQNETEPFMLEIRDLKQLSGRIRQDSGYTGLFASVATEGYNFSTEPESLNTSKCSNNVPLDL